MTARPDLMQRARAWLRDNLINQRLRALEGLTQDLAALLAAVEREAIERAGVALFERSRAERRNAKTYKPREDGGDGSRELCLESATSFADAAVLVRALAAPETPRSGE